MAWPNTAKPFFKTRGGIGGRLRIASPGKPGSLSLSLHQQRAKKVDRLKTLLQKMQQGFSFYCTAGSAELGGVGVEEGVGSGAGEVLEGSLDAGGSTALTRI